VHNFFAIEASAIQHYKILDPRSLISQRSVC